MKILFIIKESNLQILSNQLWLTGNIFIKDMDNDHIHNAILWCWRREQAEKQLGLSPIKVKEFTYYEWRLILQAEKNRREENQKMALREKLQQELDILQPKAAAKRRISELKAQLEGLL